MLSGAASSPGECLSLPETLAAATPAQTAGVGAGLSWGLGWGLDVGCLPFSHLHSTHTAGLQHKHKEKEREREEEARVKRRSNKVQLQVEVETHVVQLEGGRECDLKMRGGGATAALEEDSLHRVERPPLAGSQVPFNGYDTFCSCVVHLKGGRHGHTTHNNGHQQVEQPGGSK